MINIKNNIAKENICYSPNIPVLTLNQSYIDDWYIVVTDPRSARSSDHGFEPIEPIESFEAYKI